MINKIKEYAAEKLNIDIDKIDVEYFEPDGKQRVFFKYYRVWVIVDENEAPEKYIVLTRTSKILGIERDNKNNRFTYGVK